MAKNLTIIPKNLQLPTARILDSSDSEFYQEVQAKTSEKFGKDSQAYKTIMNGINPGNATGSQFFFNTQAGLYLPDNQRIATLDDWDAIWSTDQAFIQGNYSDISALVLRSETPTWSENTQILENLVKQAKGRGLEFSPENPLLISNPQLVADENPKNNYGLLLKITDETSVTNDPRFVSNRHKITIGNSDRNLYTKQDGLSRVFLDVDGSVNSGYDDLSISYGSGRVVVFDAVGVALSDFVTNEVKPYQDKVVAIEKVLRKE